MFNNKRTISSANINFSNNSYTFNKPYNKNIQDLTDIDYVSNHKQTFSQYDKNLWNTNLKIDVHMQEEINVIGQTGNTFAYITYEQTDNINIAFENLKNEVTKRGVQYANNTTATRGGLMAENFVAETYNLDAVIKKSPDRAIVPASNANGSPDIIYDSGNKQASLKFYKDAESSAKRQTDPKYGEQERIIPQDQLENGKEVLDTLADKNTKKGRYDAANQQLKTKELMNDKIVGSNGEESTPLSKSDDMKLAEAISKDGNVDNKKINEVLENTGVTSKVKKSIITNELKGIGISLAIGLGTGFAIGFVVSLAQSGVNPDCLKNSFVSGLKSGGIGLISSVVNYGIGRCVAFAVNKTIIKNISEKFAEEVLKKISHLCTTAIAGSLTIIAFSVYQFTRLKIMGFSTKESIIRVGKSAGVQFVILAVNLIFQAIWGYSAGFVVSIIGGVVITGYYIYSFNHERDLQKRIQLYAISLCEPLLSNV